MRGRTATKHESRIPRICTAIPLICSVTKTAPLATSPDENFVNGPGTSPAPEADACAAKKTSSGLVKCGGLPAEEQAADSLFKLRVIRDQSFSLLYASSVRALFGPVP